MAKKYFLLVLLISLMPLVRIFLTPDLPHTHDGFVHLSRLPAYYKALTDGQILPRWAGDLNYGYGLPLFNFIYPLPYVLGAPAIGLGVSLVTTFKILLAGSYILSGIGMFLFARQLVKDNVRAILITIFYQFAPFRFVELFVRGSLGEVYTYAFLPFVLLFLTRFFQSSRVRELVMAALSLAALILAHNSVSLLFFLIAVLFALLFAPSKKHRVFGLTALVAGLLLASFYWLPAIAEHKYTYGDLFMKDLFRTHYPPVANLILPNFLNNPARHTGGLSVQIGLFHEIALGVAVFTLLRRNIRDRTSKRIMVFALLVTGVSLFLMLQPSLFLWENVSFLRQFQFPWRFLSSIVIATSFASVAYVLHRKFFRALVLVPIALLTIFSTVYYWNPPLGFDVIRDESVYWNYPLNTTYFGETDVIWSAGPAKSYPKNPVDVIDGEAQILDFRKKSQIHTFNVRVETAARLVDYTQYFPGWRVYVDGAKVPVEFQDQNWRGLITFTVPSGAHAIRVVFGDSPTRLLAKILSTGTLLLLCILYFRLGNREVL